MKSTEVTKALKELLGVGRNEEIVAAVGQLAQQARARPGPVGMVLLIYPDGAYTVRAFGFEEPQLLGKMQQLRETLGQYVTSELTPAIRELEREAIAAQVWAEMARSETGHSLQQEEP